MSEPPRSLADSLRRFDDARLEELLDARPDLRTPVPRGLGPLAARAGAAFSTQRATSSLTLPEKNLVDALAVLPDGTDLHTLAAAVDSTTADIAPFVERLRTLALVWGRDDLHLVRSLRDQLRTPAGLAPEDDADPSPGEARRLVDAVPAALQEILEHLRWGPARLDAAPDSSLARALVEAGIATQRGEALLIPRTVHLALRGGRVHRAVPTARPIPTGEAPRERIPGARTAQAVHAAFEALRILGTVRTWDDDPPAVLQRGGIPQRDLRRLAHQADATPGVYTTVLQSAWCAGLIGHDGQEWHPTRDWDEYRDRSAESRWAELVLAWAGSHHLAVIVGTPDAQNSTRAALSDGTRREGARTRRRSLIRQLGAHPGAHVDASTLEASLRWAFPLVPDQVITEEVAALITEATTLGVIGDGGLTVLGAALAHALDLPIT
ncbi:MAG: hypothetical protein Q4G40_11460, partial [Brachybacterium sp.]|nr:hypothetical protein [Brachybacterium sp.]